MSERPINKKCHRAKTKPTATAVSPWPWRVGGEWALALRAKQRREKLPPPAVARRKGPAADRTEGVEVIPHNGTSELSAEGSGGEGARTGMFATKEEAIQALMRDKRDRGMTAEQRRDAMRGATFRDHESAHQG